MTARPRLLPLLLTQKGRLLRAVGFSDRRPLGDSESAARRFLGWEPDELLLLSVDDPNGAREFADLVARLRRISAVPLTVGGGISSRETAALLFHAGADRVALNAGALARPDLISEVADRWGSQAVVMTLVCSQSAPGRAWRVERRTADGGYLDAGTQALDWALACAKLGAGEILAIDRQRDGTGLGLPLPLIETLARELPVPLMAAGGVDGPEDVVDGFAAGAAAVAVGNALHYRELGYPHFRSAVDEVPAETRRAVA